MKKEQTAARKAASTRNRHNGTKSLWYNTVVARGVTFVDSYGQKYYAVPSKQLINKSWNVTASIVKCKD